MSGCDNVSSIYDVGEVKVVFNVIQNGYVPPPMCKDQIYIDIYYKVELLISLQPAMEVDATKPCLRHGSISSSPTYFGKCWAHGERADHQACIWMSALDSDPHNIIIVDAADYDN